MDVPVQVDVRIDIPGVQRDEGVELAPAPACQERGEVHLFDLYGEPAGGQLFFQHLGDLHRLRDGGDRHHLDGHATRVTGLRQQLAAACRVGTIVGQPGGGNRPPGRYRRRNGPACCGAAGVDHLDQLRPVDRQAERLPHPQVAERRAFGLDPEQTIGEVGHGHHPQLGDAAQRPGRGDVHAEPDDQVQLARPQGRPQRGGIGNDPVDGGVRVRQAVPLVVLAPVPLVPHQPHRSGAELGELEGPRAQRLHAGVADLVLKLQGHDPAAAARQHREEGGGRLPQRDLHHERIDDRDLLHRGQEAGLGRAGGRIEDAVDRVLHIGRIQGAPVVKGHVAPQRDRVLEAVGRDGPRLRQPGFNIERPRVESQQGFVDEIQYLIRGERRRDVRVEIEDFLRDPDAQRPSPLRRLALRLHSPPGEH